ncbi:hypothetical protein [Paenibacillus paridis]|uniref:hypothetical protein n=1 Tax=Paenibacillus paridis TaxID=2583376 RepID=UPI001123AAB8|nr:hypothetical protein [Paenibacillus paridis]
MGMDFVCYIGHQLSKNDLIQMSEQLNKGSFKYISAFIEDLLKYNPDDVNQKWEANTEVLGDELCLYGPCCLKFTFSEQVCKIDHFTRWLTFILNDSETDFRGHLRNVAYELTRYFHSTFAIYVPDSGVKESAIMDFFWDDENKSIDYMKEWLLTNCGEPKREIEDIFQDGGDYWESDGYFIDYFKDYTE